jgi:hypothetical protein
MFNRKLVAVPEPQGLLTTADSGGWNGSPGKAFEAGVTETGK